MITWFPLFEEDLFVTMQVAVLAKDGLIVLAGDTKIRSQDRTYTDQPAIPYGMVNHSKIVFGEHHDVAVAFAGHADTGRRPALELAQYLSSLPSLPQMLGPTLTSWGAGFFKNEFGDSPQRDYPICSMLVVNPKAPCPFWKLNVNKISTEDSSCTVMVNGLGTNAAIFWLEYFRTDKTRTLDLDVATGIASTTILMAGELDSYRIGGLEVYRYTGKWDPLGPSEIDGIHASFDNLEKELHRLVPKMSVRPENRHVLES